MLECLRERRAEIERRAREPTLVRLHARPERRVFGEHRLQHPQALAVEHAQRLQPIRIETPPVADVGQYRAQSRLRLSRVALGQPACEDARGIERCERIEGRGRLRCPLVEHRLSPVGRRAGEDAAVPAADL